MDIVEDPAYFINQSFLGLLSSIVQGSLLAIIVTLFFLGVFNNALIVISALPLTLIYSFILMRIFNVSINLISLSGMALGVGMTVDASVVVVENIHRHRLEAQALGQNIPLFAIITRSVQEVRLSVVASLLTSICVFLPLAFTAALAHALLGDLAKVIVFSLVTSLLVALTEAPLLYYFLFRPSRLEKNHSSKKRWLARLWTHSTQKIEALSQANAQKHKKAYGAILTWLLLHPKAKRHQIFTLCGVVALVMLSLFLFSNLKIEFMAEPQSNQIVIFASNSEYNEITDLLEGLRPVDAQIQEIFGVHLKSMYMHTFKSFGAVYLVKIDKKRHARRWIEKLTADLKGENWDFSVYQYDPASLPLPDIYALHLRVVGPDRFKVLEYMEQLQDQINRLENKHKIDPNTGLPQSLYLFVETKPRTTVTNELGIILRPETLEHLGISEKTLLETARMALDTKKLTMEYEGDEIDIQFKYPEITTREKAMNILVPYKNTGIPLSHFFEAQNRKGIPSILVEDKQEVYNIKARVRDKEFNPVTIKAYAKQVQEEVLDHFVMEPGYSIVLVDGQKDLHIAIDSLCVAFFLAVL